MGGLAHLRLEKKSRKAVEELTNGAILDDFAQLRHVPIPQALQAHDKLAIDEKLREYLQP